MLLTDYGGIHYTTNGGADWTKQNSNTNNWLLGIDVSDGNKIWICGNPGGGNDYTHILHSDNKGQTWQDQTPQLFPGNNLNNLSKIRALKVVSEE